MKSKHYLDGFTACTGVLESSDGQLAVQYKDKDSGQLKTCFLNATTKFIGAIPDRLAMDTLAKRTEEFPGLGLTVNVWVRGNNKIANYASPNWR